MLKGYGLPRSGRRAVLLARLTAHEAALVSPPFIVVTEIPTFRFLDLPNEVRNMIYKEVFIFKGKYRPCVGNILAANKQVYNEGKGLLYSLNTINIKLDSLHHLRLMKSSRPLVMGPSWRKCNSIYDRSYNPDPPFECFELPTYLGRCEKLKIILFIKHFWPEEFQLSTPTKLEMMLVDFNSLVYTTLVKHQHLRTIHLELEIDEKYNRQPLFIVTNQERRYFEQLCLNTLGQLRGL